MLNHRHLGGRREPTEWIIGQPSKPRPAPVHDRLRAPCSYSLIEPSSASVQWGLWATSQRCPSGSQKSPE